MFWVRNIENSFTIHTLIWRSVNSRRQRHTLINKHVRGSRTLTEDWMYKGGIDINDYFLVSAKTSIVGLYHENKQLIDSKEKI